MAVETAEQIRRRDPAFLRKMRAEAHMACCESANAKLRQNPDGTWGWHYRKKRWTGVLSWTWDKHTGTGYASKTKAAAGFVASPAFRDHYTREPQTPENDRIDWWHDRIIAGIVVVFYLAFLGVLFTFANALIAMKEGYQMTQSTGYYDDHTPRPLKERLSESTRLQETSKGQFVAVPDELAREALARIKELEALTR